MIHPDPQTGHMIKASLRKSHLRVTHQQIDSIDHVITNISRDMIMSVHNEIVIHIRGIYTLCALLFPCDLNFVLYYIVQR